MNILVISLIFLNRVSLYPRKLANSQHAHFFNMGYSVLITTISKKYLSYTIVIDIYNYSLYSIVLKPSTVLMKDRIMALYLLYRH